MTFHRVLACRTTTPPNFDAGKVDVWDSNPNPIENTAAFIDSSAAPILKIQMATTGVGTALIRASGVNIPGVTAV